MQMPDGYQIPDDPENGRMDAAYLRTCLGIMTPLSGQSPAFPLEVRRAYFHMAHSLSRLGALSRGGMDATQIATVAALATMYMYANEEAERPTFLSAIESGRAKEGRKVVFLYRKVEQPGHFLRMEEDKVIVLHGGLERKCSPTSVRLSEPNEFPDVSEFLEIESAGV